MARGRTSQRGVEAGQDSGLRRPRSVAFLLSALGHASSRRLIEALAPLGIGPRDMALLRLIADAGGLAQGDLSRRLGIPPSRMVALIDDFEGRELVERRSVAGDRRVRAVHPTARGRRLLERAETIAHAHEAATCADLSAKERDQLLALLERVGDTLRLPGAVHPALAERRRGGGASVSTNDQREGR